MTDTVCDTLWKRPIRGTARSAQKMALEMEMLAFDARTFAPLGLPGARVDPQELLHRIAHASPHAKLKTDAASGITIGVEFPSGSNFSVEPGGQVEYASAPAARFDELCVDIVTGLSMLETAGRGEVVFASHGTNPLAIEGMPLVLPKSRYKTLRRYFLSEPGGRGADMMVNTCTVQPNLDVSGGDEAWNDAVNLTFVLTPFVRHLFSNSRYYQGAPSRFPSERQAIWAQTDHSRSGIPIEVPFADDPACAYANWARSAFVFLVSALPPEEQPAYGELTFAQWLAQGYKGAHPTLQDWEIHLGTLFPELRLRGFLEVRCVDAQPFEHTLAVVAFWSGLLQSADARARTWDFLSGIARTYAHCSSGRSLPPTFTSTVPTRLDAKDVDIYRDLMSEDPNHPLFQDARLHSQLLNIAAEALHARGEPLAVASLRSYGEFLQKKPEYWNASSARAFVERTATHQPSRQFMDFIRTQSVVATP